MDKVAKEIPRYCKKPLKAPRQNIILVTLNAWFTREYNGGEKIVFRLPLPLGGLANEEPLAVNAVKIDQS
jgi:hypothetical protein